MQCPRGISCHSPGRTAWSRRPESGGDNCSPNAASAHYGTTGAGAVTTGAHTFISSGTRSQVARWGSRRKYLPVLMSPNRWETGMISSRRGNLSPGNVTPRQLEQDAQPVKSLRRDTPTGNVADQIMRAVGILETKRAIKKVRVIPNYVKRIAPWPSDYVYRLEEDEPDYDSLSCPEFVAGVFIDYRGITSYF